MVFSLRYFIKIGRENLEVFSFEDESPAKLPPKGGRFFAGTTLGVPREIFKTRRATSLMFSVVFGLAALPAALLLPLQRCLTTDRSVTGLVEHPGVPNISRLTEPDNYPKVVLAEANQRTTWQAKLPEQKLGTRKLPSKPLSL